MIVRVKFPENVVHFLSGIRSDTEFFWQFPPFYIYILEFNLHQRGSGPINADNSGLDLSQCN